MKKIRAQSLLEYSVFIFCLVAALITMQVYIKRGIQGKLRQSADDVGEQFDPKHTSSNVINTVKSTTVTNETLIKVQPGDPYYTYDPKNNQYYTVTTVTNDPSIDSRSTPETSTRTGNEDVEQFPSGGLYE